MRWMACFLAVKAILLLWAAVALVDCVATAGLEPGMLSPLAQLTVINGAVERDDLYYFQVLTEAWQSTRVRVSIEDCTPRTAVIAAFGAEPTPSQHELLAHAMLDLSGNGTCGVDVISRPSFSRDGVWHFAVVGGSPLRGDRYFAGPPDTLAFEAAVIAESAVYPTLDRGVAAPGDCLRKVAVPPVVVPKITGPPGSSSSRHDGSTKSWSGSFLPTLGRFPAAGSASGGGKLVRTGGPNGAGAEEELPPPAGGTANVLSPSWLGAFTVSAYDEIVTVPFEVAALVDGEEAEVTVCAAAARIALTLEREEEDGGDDDEPPPGENGQQSVCRSVVVKGEGAAVSGVLQLPDRPQTGRWYLTARAACDTVGRGRRLRRRRRTLGAAAGGPAVETQDAEGGGEKGEEGREGAAGGAGRKVRAGLSAAKKKAGRGELEGGQRSIYSGSGWGLEVMSLQRDWAHMEWSGDFLVPGASGGVYRGGTEPGDGVGAADEWEEACLSADGGEDAFVFRAAAIAEACPRGAVGVSGVDLSAVSAGAGAAPVEGKETAAGGGQTSQRFSCVGAELPMLMRRDGAARVHEGQPQALSNFIRDEGGTATAAAAAPPAAAGGGGSDDAGGEGTGDGGAPRWRWRGPGPPSLWYALEMSGREVGASMEVRLSVNSSAPLTAAAASSGPGRGRGGSLPTAWHMGPGPGLSSSSAAAASGGGADARGGDEGQKIASVYPSANIEAASSMNLSVAMRVGALPVIDPNGTALEGTVVLWTADALSEPGEANDQPPYGYDNTVGSGGRGADVAAADSPPWWSTTFTWNLTHPPPLHPGTIGGGAGLGRGTAATTLFVVVSAETAGEASARANRYGRGGAGEVGSGARRTTEDKELEAEEAEGAGVGSDELLWTLGVAPEVTFRYCNDDVCPAGRGECRAARGGSGDDYVTVSKCYCFYGYGGEACAQRVVSYVSMLWQFCLLVLSNLAVVPAVRLALRLGAATGAAPAVVLGLNGAASALYHTCDLELTCVGGMVSFHTLQALDFFFSFFSVAALVLHLCPMPWDEPLFSSSSPTSLVPSPAIAAGAGTAAANPVAAAMATASAAGTAAEFLAAGGGGGGSEDGSTHRRRSRGITPAVADDESDGLDGLEGDGSDGNPVGGLQQVQEGSDHLLLDDNIETPRANSAHGRAWTRNRHQGSGGGSGGGGSIVSNRKGGSSLLSVDGNGSRAHRRWAGGGSGSGGGGGVGSDGGDSLAGTAGTGNGKEDGASVAGSRLASLYVCLIPPLLAGVTDHPTAGANLAVVFAMCGGLLAFSWGRLVARDMREKAQAEAAAAEQRRRRRQRQERWLAGSVGSTAAAIAALDEDWDEEEGRADGGGGVGIGVGVSGAAGGRGGQVGALSASNGAGVKHGAVPSPSSGWSLRKDEVEEGEEDGRRPEEAGEGEGEAMDRSRVSSFSRSNSHLQRGGGGGGGGGGDGVGAVGADVADETTFSTSNSSVPTDSSSLPLMQRPRARSIGGNRARRGESNGWSTNSGSGLTMEDEALIGSTTSGDTSTRLGRIRTLLRSLKRVTVKQGLLDWRQLGLGTAGFAAGLACFAVQGSSATAGWYHLWHGAWHVLAMSSAVPLLRARKWGPAESDPDEDGGLWGCGGSGPPGEVGGQQSLRSVRAVGLRARWESLGPGFGGRVETRSPSYEMVPRT